MLTQEYDYIFKLLIIGTSAVGKSSLLLRFAENTFTDSFLPTIGVDFKIKTVENSGSIIKLQMWDTAGQQKFKTIVASYYKNAHGIILVYDVTDKSSFKEVQNWINEADKYAPQSAIRILVANKIDLAQQRQVSTEQGKKFSQTMGMKYIETSVKNNINVQTAFNTLINQIKLSIPKKPAIKDKFNFQLSQTDRKVCKNKATCCGI